MRSVRVPSPAAAVPRLVPSSRQPLCPRQSPASSRCSTLRQSEVKNGNGAAPAEEPVSGAQMMAETGATASGTSLMSKELHTLTVRDMMTSPAYSLAPETEVTQAMEFMVDKGISGVPVIDSDKSVLGVCSGYDLLALDSTPGKLDKSYFPPIDTCINEFGGDRKMMWSSFKQLRKKLKAANGRTVQEVCITNAKGPDRLRIKRFRGTSCFAVAGFRLAADQIRTSSTAFKVMHRAFKIDPNATMEDAANMIVQKQAHRICVIEDGKLIGIVSRGDVMRATISNFKAYMSRQDAKEEAS